ncbi:Hypothetical_protein [Hexamita inflata]|uniref:Hypothetical_protein n=1 Tax=Hexamita inflata TaxID=28002 RepID=A0AA86UCC8_9EUKA|nr:Hypothetical protein HINF_LOCUS7151 [Hexamita inflata]CAI9936597.1 Hypothetical protein HINF_LOCUS24242 [Hexamita inflata]CAI9936598.1 Hypothetical protein HINF_LOCUS24243 [Hexamita inflata]CAI9936599.1 Hypothetical protein HINF_LOCUS24244 [Hexamita inflata]CAI9936600.1 Hypothetical protein HINF_LOCUS24245 [Hexamita inflata]
MPICGLNDFFNNSTNCERNLIQNLVELVHVKLSYWQNPKPAYYTKQSTSCDFTSGFSSEFSNISFDYISGGSENLRCCLSNIVNKIVILSKDARHFSCVEPAISPLLNFTAHINQKSISTTDSFKSACQIRIQLSCASIW